MNATPGMTFQPAVNSTRAMIPHAIHAAAMANKVSGFDGRLPARTGPSIGLFGRRGPCDGDCVGGGGEFFGGVTRPPLRFRSATPRTVPGEA